MLCWVGSHITLLLHIKSSSRGVKQKLFMSLHMWGKTSIVFSTAVMSIYTNQYNPFASTAGVHTVLAALYMYYVFVMNSIVHLLTDVWMEGQSTKISEHCKGFSKFVHEYYSYIINTAPVWCWYRRFTYQGGSFHVPSASNWTAPLRFDHICLT